jgi:hypothetical protein
MMTMLAAAGAPFESRTSAGTAASAIWPATTAATIVSAAIIAIPSAAAAAERPLKASTWIAAYPRGVTREIRARLGSAGARCAGFAGEEDAVILCDGWRRRGFCSGSLDVFGLHGFVGFIVADGCGVQRTLVCRICFRFAERVRVKGACLKSCDLFRSYVVRLGFRLARMNLIVLFRFFGTVVGRFVFFLFFLLFLIFFLKNGATDERVGRNFCLCFLMLGFDETGGDYRDIFFTEGSVGASRFCVHQIRSGLRRSGSRVVSGRR